MYYFIYKTLQITGMGGITIPTIQGIDGGQGTYGEWLLGTTDDMNKLLLIKEFQPRLVSENVWKGFGLIGKTEIDEIDGGEIITRPLTEQEIIYQKEATNWQYKEDARNAIDVNVGDYLDQIANVDKQVQVITPVVVRMYKLVLDLYDALNREIPSGSLPQDVKAQYDVFTTQYLSAIESGLYKDRVDIEPNPTEMINRLLTNNATTATIVKTQYINKKI